MGRDIESIEVEDFSVEIAEVEKLYEDLELRRQKLQTSLDICIEKIRSLHSAGSFTDQQQQLWLERVRAIESDVQVKLQQRESVLITEVCKPLLLELERII